MGFFVWASYLSSRYEPEVRHSEKGNSCLYVSLLSAEAKRYPAKAFTRSSHIKKPPSRTALFRVFTPLQLIDLDILFNFVGFFDSLKTLVELSKAYLDLCIMH